MRTSPCKFQSGMVQATCGYFFGNFRMNMGKLYPTGQDCQGVYTKHENKHRCKHGWHSRFPRRARAYRVSAESAPLHARHCTLEYGSEGVKMKHNAVEHARKSRKSDRCASHKGEEVVAAGGAEVWMRQMEILDLAGNRECTQSQSQGTLANGPQPEKFLPYSLESKKTR